MKHEKLLSALSEISDRHIAEAAPKPRNAFPWAVLAACLALVLAIGVVVAGLSNQGNPPISMEVQPTTQPIAPSGEKQDYPVPPPLKESEIFTPELVRAENLLASPQYPQLTAYSNEYNQWEKWREDYRALHSNTEGYADSLTGFFLQSIPEFLSGDTENAAYSPVSLYMALAMLAQTTGGKTQQEILDLLGADTAAALAEQAGILWRNHYWNDGATTSVFANSLWLDDQFLHNQDTVDLIADSLYASVYQGVLESAEMNIALKDWLNANTGGLLENSIRNLNAMDQSTALVLASTMLFRVQWSNKFSKEQNTEGIFKSSVGDQSVTFMNTTTFYSPYYWGEDFSATYLYLEDDSKMWLILPNEGKSPNDILSSGYALDMILSYKDDSYEDTNSYPNQHSAIINLSLPKFDITADLDLKEGLKDLGVKKAFSQLFADFSGIEAEDQGLYLNETKQATRVAIDEDGVIAASYTVMMEAYGAMPPTEEVDLVLDRPFLFVVESADGITLFTGIVNQP